eukprot:749816-Hanusia_phi.AAC.5
MGRCAARGIVRRVRSSLEGQQGDSTLFSYRKISIRSTSNAAKIPWVAKAPCTSSSRIAIPCLSLRSVHGSAETQTSAEQGAQEGSSRTRKGGVLVLWDLYSKPPTNGDVVMCVERLRQVASSLGQLKNIKVFGRPAKDGGALGTGSITPYFSAQLRHGRKMVHPNLHKNNDKVAHWTGDRWVIMPVMAQLNAVPSELIEEGEKGETLHLNQEDIMGENERWCKVCETLVCIPCWPGCTRLVSKLRQVQTERDRWKISRIKHDEDVSFWFRNRHDYFHKRKTTSFRPKYFADTVEKLSTSGVDYVDVDWKGKQTADGLLKNYLAWSIHAVLDGPAKLRSDQLLMKNLSGLSEDPSLLSDVETILVVTDGNHRERSLLKR